VNVAVKYTLGRIGLFLAVFGALLPVPIDLFLKLIAAGLLSPVLSFFLLRAWRDELAAHLAAVAERRRAEKERLRTALAGDDARPASPLGDAGNN